MRVKIIKTRADISITVTKDVPHYCPALVIKNWTSNHEQKSLCGSCSNQHQMQRDPGGISPTCASSNRQTDFWYGLQNQQELSTCLNLSRPWSGKAWRVLKTWADNREWDRLCLSATKPSPAKKGFQHHNGAEKTREFGHSEDNERSCASTTPLKAHCAR